MQNDLFGETVELESPNTLRNLSELPAAKTLIEWCEDLNAVQSAVTCDFVYMAEEGFENYKPRAFADLLTGFREYKEPAAEHQERV